MAARAGGNPPLHVALGDQGLALRQDFGADDGDRGGWKRGPLRREMVCHLLEERIGQIREKVVHRRVFAPQERDKLVEEIAGRLSREPGHVLVLGAFSQCPVTGCASEDAGRHRILRTINRLRLRYARLNSEQNETSPPEMSVLHHRFDFLFDDGKAARIIAGAPATNRRG